MKKRTKSLNDFIEWLDDKEKVGEAQDGRMCPIAEFYKTKNFLEPFKFSGKIFVSCMQVQILDKVRDTYIWEKEFVKTLDCSLEAYHMVSAEEAKNVLIELGYMKRRSR